MAAPNIEYLVDGEMLDTDPIVIDPNQMDLALEGGAGI